MGAVADAGSSADAADAAVAHVAEAHVAVAVEHVAHVAVVGKQRRLEEVNETDRREGANTVAGEHRIGQLGDFQLDCLMTFQ